MYETRVEDVFKQGSSHVVWGSGSIHSSLSAVCYRSSSILPHLSHIQPVAKECVVMNSEQEHHVNVSVECSLKVVLQVARDRRKLLLDVDTNLSLVFLYRPSS